MRRAFFAPLIALALAAPAAAQDGKGAASDAGPGQVVVQNRLGRSVVVWINGELQGSVEAGADARFPGVPSGRIDVQAGVSGEGPVASEQRALAAGETFTWTLYPVAAFEEEKGTGTVVLRNALDRVVEVYFGENPVATLAPGATRAHARIVAGEVEAVARAEDGEVVEERRLEIEPGRIARWEIGASTGEATRTARPPREGS